MTITGGSALSKDDIDKMVRDAEQYAEEDRQRREAVDVRNQGDSLVHTTEKFLAENGDKVGDELKNEVQADVDALKESLNGDDTEAIKTATAKLAESSQKLGTAMYEAAAAEAASAPSGDADGAADDDVVDAEIVEDDDTEGTK